MPSDSNDYYLYIISTEDLNDGAGAKPRCTGGDAIEVIKFSFCDAGFASAPSCGLFFLHGLSYNPLTDKLVVSMMDYDHEV